MDQEEVAISLNVSNQKKSDKDFFQSLKYPVIIDHPSKLLELASFVITPVLILSALKSHRVSQIGFLSTQKTAHVLSRLPASKRTMTSISERAQDFRIKRLNIADVFSGKKTLPSVNFDQINLLFRERFTQLLVATTSLAFVSAIGIGLSLLTNKISKTTQSESNKNSR